MKKIIIIGCYFGQLRVDAPLFLESIRENSSIDWIIFSDCDWGKVPRNMKIVEISFKELKVLIQEKFEFPISLETPYKLCDFKPAYGEIFSEYINDYDFWGHCDFDMVFGNLRKFLTEDKLEKFDRIYYQGHLSIYRNIDKINHLYQSNKGELYYKDVFSSPLIWVFDEVDGMYKIFKNEKVPIYSEVEYIDVYPYLNLMLHPRKEHNISKKFPINYARQVFGYRDGGIYKWFVKNGKLEEEEYAYIHFSHKVFVPIDNSNYYFTRRGVVTAEMEKVPFEKYRRGVDELRMNVAEIIFRVKRKLRKRSLSKF